MNENQKKKILSKYYCQILFVDMTGIIPEDEDEEQGMYDDVGPIEDTADSEPIDEDIYEELPGPTMHFSVQHDMNKLRASL